MRTTALLAFTALLLVGCDPTEGFPTFPTDPVEEPTDPDDPPEAPPERPTDPADGPNERPQEPVDRPAERPEEPGTRPPERPEEPADDPVDAPPERPEEPADDPVDAPPERPEDPPPPPAPTVSWAADLAIADVLLYQGSSVALTPAGPAPLAATEVPVVAGREALVRVMLAPQPRWSARPVTVHLEIEDAAGSTAYSLDVTPYAASTEADLASSANFTVPGAVITPDASVVVSLHEALAQTPGADEPGAARFPTTGAAPLQAIENGGVVEVWFVPLTYAPDGSQRAPDTSPDQIELLRSSLERQYPVSDVLVDVLPPVALAGALAADGDGWTDALYQVSNLREALAVPDDVYLYGLVAPRPDFSEYCRSGCVSGLSWVGTNPQSAWSRASLGLGYTGPRAADTFTHEVGHAHGRTHSPCGGPAHPDPNFPNGGGRLGTWGWDAEDVALIDPATHGDLMSYCRPRWVSDYTFAALSDRIQQVNASAFTAALPGWPRTFHVLDTAGSGPPAVRSELSLDRPPEGAEVKLDAYAEDRSWLGVVIGTEQRFEDVKGSAILFEAPEGTASVRYGGRYVAVD